MNTKTTKVRALGLCSGGLDSILSAVLLKKQGIWVEWVSFETPFFSAEKARQAAEKCDIPLTVQKITSIYIEMLKNPPCGYGKHMNPCLDCHTLMFRLAGGIMHDRDFHFLFSGEVLGQRPMSQTLSSLRYVEKHSGFADRILRPLSAKCLQPTPMEENGWVDRERLLDLSGRNRKPQIALAESFGITEYPSPAGGCLLTDEIYSKRLRDLFHHSPTPEENPLHLLKYGRHFRLADDTKLIVGRNQQDNENIVRYHSVDTEMMLHICDYPGPVAITPATIREDELLIAAAICAGYCKAPQDQPVFIDCMGPGVTKRISVKPMPPAEARRFML